MVEPTTRRSAMKLAGASMTVGLAGCSGILSSGLDVSIANKTEESVDYDVQIDDLEESGSLDGMDSDTFEEAIDDPTGEETITVKGTFGLSEFDDTLTIKSGHDKVVLSYMPNGVYISASADDE